MKITKLETRQPWLCEVDGHTYVRTKCYCGHTSYCDCGPLEEPKQETLEKVTENNYCFESDIEMVNFISEMASTGKIPNRWSAFVAKINELYLFKQEQDKKLYSEEEVLEFTKTMIQQYKFGNTNIEQMDLLKESLEQFKN
jgi:hypothetical protein